MTQTAAAGAARRAERLLDAVVEQRPVREAGERVVQRLVLDLAHPLLELCPALGERLLGDVAGRDVDHVALRVERSPGVVADADGDVVHPDDAAVACAISRYSPSNMSPVRWMSANWPRTSSRSSGCSTLPKKFGSAIHSSAV